MEELWGKGKEKVKLPFSQGYTNAISELKHAIHGADIVVQFVFGNKATDLKIKLLGQSDSD